MMLRRGLFREMLFNKVSPKRQGDQKHLSSKETSHRKELVLRTETDATTGKVGRIRDSWDPYGQKEASWKEACV